jgi:hypothetical protein
MTAKTRAIPSLHRDSFLAPLARGTRTLPGAASGNTTSPYCRAVMGNCADHVTVTETFSLTRQLRNPVTIPLSVQLAYGYTYTLK